MPTTSTSESIKARGLVKAFGDLVAVDGLDFDATPGSCLGILGPNGAGKTTTIEMLEGLVRPDRGVIVLFGMTWEHDAERIRERIGVQLQETVLPEKLRVAEALRVFQSLYPTGRPNVRSVDEVLELVGLNEKRRDFVVELSGGQRQRLSLGCALVHRPDVLFLDEPTTGLDPQGRRRIWEIVDEFKRSGGTVFLTTHFMEEAERLADELLILDHGKCLMRGTPAQIVASLGAESILEIQLAATQGSAPLAVPEGDLEQLADVLSIQVGPESVRIGAASFERVLPAALEVLRKAQLTPTDLNVHRPTLEDVFVSLTGRELRDS